MGDLESWSERRRGLRVPVRGVAVLHAQAGATRGTIENLSRSGLLVNVVGGFEGRALDVELKLGPDSGWVSARTVRIERTSRRCQIAVEFDDVDAATSEAIDAAIEAALRAVHRRPILVI